MAKGKSAKPRSEPPDGEDAQLQTIGLIVDVALREGSLTARRAVQRKLAGGDLADLGNVSLPPKASFAKRIAAAALGRLAVRSVPGALVVGGGLLAKALFDRRKRRRDSAEAVEEAGE